VRFFLDNDVPAEVAQVLRNESHEAIELREVLDVQATDEQVFREAQLRGMLLVTCNRDDFLSLATQNPNPGLIILIRRRTRQAECAHLLALLDKAGESALIGNIDFA